MAIEPVTSDNAEDHAIRYTSAAQAEILSVWLSLNDSSLMDIWVHKKIHIFTLAPLGYIEVY